MWFLEEIKRRDDSRRRGCLDGLPVLAGCAEMDPTDERHDFGVRTFANTWKPPRGALLYPQGETS